MCDRARVWLCEDTPGIPGAFGEFVFVRSVLQCFVCVCYVRPAIILVEQRKPQNASAHGTQRCTLSFVLHAMTLRTPKRTHAANRSVAVGSHSANCIERATARPHSTEIQSRAEEVVLWQGAHSFAVVTPRNRPCNLIRKFRIHHLYTGSVPFAWCFCALPTNKAMSTQAKERKNVVWSGQTKVRTALANVCTCYKQNKCTIIWSRMIEWS